MDALDLKPISDFSAELHLLSVGAKFSEVAEFITEQVAKISNANRTALIALREGELVIEGGFPANQHGVGTRLTSETGSKFLLNVMRDESKVLIVNPARDLRTQYLKGLAEHYKISSILFIPLYTRNESLGVLTFDFVGDNRNFSKEYFIKLRYVAKQVVAAMLARKHRERQEAEIKRLERLAIIGENAAHFAHAVRNRTTYIGGFAKRIVKGTAKCESCAVKEYAVIISEEVPILEKTVSEVLSFTRSVSVKPEKLDLNQFLREKISEFSKSDFFRNVHFVINLDKRLDKAGVFFDRQRLLICLTDLLKNAVEAHADAIWISTRVKHKESAAILSVSNRGERVENNMKDRLFAPFMTTKCDGTGLGLASVKAIAEAHGGRVTVEAKEFGRDKIYRTEFKIYLPFGRGPQ